MSNAGLLWATLGVTTMGMAALAMTINAHWRQFLHKRPLTLGMAMALRGMGALLLLASFGLCILADPLLMALLVWPMLLMVSAAIIAALLALHAHFFSPEPAPTKSNRRSAARKRPPD